MHPNFIIIAQKRVDDLLDNMIVYSEVMTIHGASNGIGEYPARIVHKNSKPLILTALDDFSADETSNLFIISEMYLFSTAFCVKILDIVCNLFSGSMINMW